MNKRTDRSAGQGLTTMMAPPVTARGARTRAALKKAARSLFEKQGFQSTSINQISTKARMAHGTFYTYFESKEQIFGEIVHDLYIALGQTIVSQPPVVGGDLSERIERANRGYLSAYQQNARMMAAVEQASTLSPPLAAIRRATRVGWIERNTAAITRWQERGQIAGNVDPRSAAEILGCMVDRTAYVWVVLEEKVFELEEATQQLTRLYCNALGLHYFRDGEAEPGQQGRTRAAGCRSS
ncbi:MAG: TetR/AcrR family transcriptional regulator [Ilumatobacteraceae bacterium]